MTQPAATPPTQQDTPAAPGLPYHQIHRLGAWGKHGWVRGAGGIAILFGVVVVMVPVVLLIAYAAVFAATDYGVEKGLDRIADTSNVTPVGLSFIFGVLISAIPATWFASRVLHGLKPRWLASVAPRIRWGWFGVSFGLAFLALLATLVVSAVLPQQGAEISGEVNTFTDTTRDFLLIVVLMTPLQAVAEEYAFRGYLTQAFGGIFGHAWVAVLVPALLFALAHGAQDPPIFFDRFAFGVVAGVLVIVTGGLEAGIAMHILNNLLAFGLALTYGDMTSALNPTGGSWWSIPVTLTQSVVFLGLALWAARRMGLQTRTSGSVLEPPRARV